jgi:hypothetical protein
MKIGEALKTRSSYLQSAYTIGAPMPPAAIVMADQRKKIRETYFKYYWRTVSGQHCLLAEGDIGAPISTLVNSSARLTYFHTKERAGMLPSMAAGLLYGLQDSILGPNPQDCI